MENKREVRYSWDCTYFEGKELKGLVVSGFDYTYRSSVSDPKPPSLPLDGVSSRVPSQILSSHLAAVGR